MPTYLCHGFRWHRRAVRIFVIVEKLDDAAPDWVIGEKSALEILGRFYELYDFLPDADNPDTPAAPPPQAGKGKGRQENDLSLPPPKVAPDDDAVLRHSWSAVKLLEEYTEDSINASRPYVFVADHAVRIDLNVDVAAEIAKYESTKKGKTPRRKKRMLKMKEARRGKMPETRPPEEIPPKEEEPEEDEAAEDSTDDDSTEEDKPEEKGGWFEKLRDVLQEGEEVRWYVVVCDDDERAVPDFFDEDAD